jgi:hypothetical protein
VETRVALEQVRKVELDAGVGGQVKSGPLVGLSYSRAPGAHNRLRAVEGGGEPAPRRPPADPDLAAIVESKERVIPRGPTACNALPHDVSEGSRPSGEPKLGPLEQLLTKSMDSFDLPRLRPRSIRRRNEGVVQNEVSARRDAR